MGMSLLVACFMRIIISLSLSCRMYLLYRKFTVTKFLNAALSILVDQLANVYFRTQFHWDELHFIHGRWWCWQWWWRRWCKWWWWWWCLSSYVTLIRSWREEMTRLVSLVAWLKCHVKTRRAMLQTLGSFGNRLALTRSGSTSDQQLMCRLSMTGYMT